MFKTVDTVNQWCPVLCKEQSLSYHNSCFWKFSHHKEGTMTSNMNSDDGPAVPHAVCAETGQHWLALPTICHTVHAGIDDTYSYKYHTNPWRWKQAFSEMSGHQLHTEWLIIWEDITVYCCPESFKSCIIQLKFIYAEMYYICEKWSIIAQYIHSMP
jgi:hypothetical protein